MFAHDRVQEAANALLGEDRAQVLHLQAGRNLKASFDAGDMGNEHIEEYIYHYNHAAELITDAEARLELAGLNIMLGKRLKSNTAYKAAEKLFAQAIDFLPEEPFKTNYSLAIDLFTEYGEILFLNLKYEEGEKQFDTVVRHSKSPLDSAKVYVRQINHHASHRNQDKSMKMARYALEMLGIKLPKRALKISIVIELLIVKFLLKKTNPEDILNFPVTEDPLVMAQMEVLNSASVPAYLDYPEFFPILIFKRLRISITKGNCVVSPTAYASYATILCSLGDLDRGYYYGKSAIALMEKLGSF